MHGAKLSGYRTAALYSKSINSLRLEPKDCEGRSLRLFVRVTRALASGQRPRR